MSAKCVDRNNTKNIVTQEKRGKMGNAKEQYQYITTKNKGSITVEAACVFPLFLFVMYAILTICQMLITTNEIHSALTETARYAAKYDYVQQHKNRAGENREEKNSENGSEIKENDITDIIINKSVLQWQFRKYLDKTKLWHIKGGTAGISLAKSQLDSDDNMLQLRADATICISLPLIKDFTIPVQEEIRQKAFLGYDNTTSLDSGDYVYVAQTGEVYHTDLSCSHICIKIIAKSELDSTNKKYCKHCMKDKVIEGDCVTLYGDCLHSDINCSSLKRTIRLVRKDQINHLPLCQKCAGKE